MDHQLQSRQARETGICPVREELYCQCFGTYAELLGHLFLFLSHMFSHSLISHSHLILSAPYLSFFSSSLLSDIKSFPFFLNPCLFSPLPLHILFSTLFFAIITDELIRQITINCAERGLLLLRVRDEARMTIAGAAVDESNY